jgi:hypothetical protein
MADEITICQQIVFDNFNYVEMYKAIRAADVEDKYPVDFNTDYPTDFGRIVEERTLFLQNKINKLYKNKNKFITKSKSGIKDYFKKITSHDMDGILNN